MIGRSFVPSPSNETAAAVIVWLRICLVYPVICQMYGNVFLCVSMLLTACVCVCGNCLKGESMKEPVGRVKDSLARIYGCMQYICWC